MSRPLPFHRLASTVCTGLFLTWVGTLPLVAQPENDAAEEPAPPPSAGVARFAQGVEAILPGRLLAHASLGDGSLALLVRSDEEAQGTSQVLRLGISGDGSLATVLVSEEELESLHWVAGDRPRLLAASDQLLLEVPVDGGQPRVVLEEPGLDPAEALDRGRLSGVAGALAMPRVSGLEVWHPNALGVYQSHALADLPVTVRRRQHGIELRTPRPRVLSLPTEGDGASTERIFVGPEVEGRQRLRMLEILPQTPEALAAAETARPATDDEEVPPGLWAQLPRPEDIDQSWLLEADGRALLAVATTNAEKLGIFEKLGLRVFPLRADRTRAGVGPSLTVTTATRNWYSIDLEIVDLDADGRDDLAVLQPEGLGAGELVIEVYRGKGTGGFFRQPRSSKLKTSTSSRRYGDDIDGDGQPDLLLRSGSQLLLYPGAEAKHKKRVLTKNPRVLLEGSDLGGLPSVTAAANDEERGEVLRFRGRPGWIDLGAGRHGILLRSGLRGRTVLRLLDAPGT